ncbi:4'-phosphopantetheinyl transferase family protein [Arthrobacter sp. KNU40]|uniref:4'-phosphopantetheinyl transferase family protein n=1 Tax=Arthrobacter sp. KNU40 TaxID=3447965 RepID=UPI003F646023
MTTVLLAQIPDFPMHLDVDADFIPAERLQTIARKRHLADRVRSRVADLLLHSLSSDRGGRSHDYLPSGRPQCVGAPVGLSASHDGEWVCAAAAPEPVGIDIVALDRVERMRPDSFLSGKELSMYRDTPSAARRQFLAQAWAAKEAYVKRFGVGLARHPSSLTVCGSGPSNASVSGPEGTVFVRIADPVRSHLIAVTLPHREAAIKFVNLGLISGMRPHLPLSAILPI